MRRSASRGLYGLAMAKRRPLRYRGLSDAQIERLGPVARVVRRLIRYLIMRYVQEHDVR